jgi:hypothetical protein
MTEEAPTGQTVQHRIEDPTPLIEQELIAELKQQMQQQEEAKLIHVALRAQMTVDAQTASIKDHKAPMDQE